MAIVRHNKCRVAIEGTIRELIVVGIGLDQRPLEVNLDPLDIRRPNQEVD